MESQWIESLYKSLVRNVVDIQNEIKARSISPDMEYYAWDTRGNVTELPNVDLIGITGFSYEENEGLPVIQIGILVSSVLDTNAFKEVQILDVIRNACVDGDHYKTWKLRDPATGSEWAQLQVANFEIMPAGRSEVRTTRAVGIELLKTSSGSI